MPRYRLLIEYDGTGYVGWQSQAKGPTVQQAIETALTRLTRAVVPIQAAGRTDAGVHATGQVAHCDLPMDWTNDRLCAALNAYLRGHRIAIVRADQVPDSFQARFSAIRRHYVYVILNRRAPPTLERNHVWHVRAPLALAPMQEAASQLLGYHDFTTFRATECQAKSPMRTLERLEIVPRGDCLDVHVASRSFLHHQVRSIVGTLVPVGMGRWSVADVRAALEARDRTRCGPVAPPDGLCLTGVDYEEVAVSEDCARHP
jgi:tRNA pseudouridine38-40 synthase